MDWGGGGGGGGWDMGGITPLAISGLLNCLCDL